jgi:hypothetical protein
MAWLFAFLHHAAAFALVAALAVLSFLAALAAGRGAFAGAAPHRASGACRSRGDPAVRGPDGARDRFDIYLREEQ